MDDILRTFIAVDIVPGDELKGVVDDLKKSLVREDIKWIKKGDMHLTLKFLGDTEAAKTDYIISLLSDIAEIHSGFSYELEGLGYFKNKGVPKVLFAKIVDSNNLVKLAEEIDYRLSEAGFERESRPFSPHLTLARIRNLNNKSAFYGLVDQYGNCPLQLVTINELILYKSILTQRGPYYTKLAAIRL